MAPAVINITIPVPCVQGMFGKRLVTYTTQIRPSQIKQILGHDPRSKTWRLLPDSTREIYQQIQRKTSKDRRDGVAEYLLQRLSGPRKSVAAFPSISIGISEHTEFKGMTSTDDPIGVLHIHDKGHRIVLDGLGRISGCLDLIEDKEVGGEAIVESIALPVTFYLPAEGTEPLSITELGQLFADFNFRVHPVPPQINMSLDQSDMYISFANELAKRPVIALHGGMEFKAASLGKKSTALVVQTVLVRAVRGATEGRDFQESNLAQPKNANLNDSTFISELSSVAGFFTEIEQRMGGRWAVRESLHLSSPGWQALGVIHYDMHHRGLDLSIHEKAAIYDAIAKINWARTNREWVDEAKLGVWDKPKGAEVEQIVILGAGRNNTQAIIDFLRRRSGLDEKIKSLKVQDDPQDLVLS
jgi:DGQHR domain-containing protein